MTAYVHAIHRALGDPAPIAELPELAADPLRCEYLIASGLRDYRRSALTPPALAAEAIAGTLAAAAVDPREIDAVVWGSTSFQERAWYTDDVSRTLTAHGLTNATPIGTTLSECGNLASVLRVASMLVGARHRHVLAVVADRCASSEQRVVPPNVSVLSDGAAACLVSAEPRGFELLALHQVTHHRARYQPGDEAVRVLRHNAEGMRRAAQGALAAAAVEPAAITRVITNNLARTVLELFAAQCRVPFERVYLGNLAGNGHVFAADGLINLADAAPGPGELVLLATNGTCNWGAMVLRPVGRVP